MRDDVTAMESGDRDDFKYDNDSFTRRSRSIVLQYALGLHRQRRY